LSLVRSEEVSVNLIRELCEELKPCILPAGLEDVGLLGECVLELYLGELCEGCNVIVDNRTTLRRYYVVFDVELQRWICGSEFAIAPYKLYWLGLSDYLYKALRRGEARVDLRLELEAELSAEGGGLRVSEARGIAARIFGVAYPTEGLRWILLKVLEENLDRYRDLILKSAEDFFKRLLDSVVESCGYVIGSAGSAGTAYTVSVLDLGSSLYGAADALCLRVSKRHYAGELTIHVAFAGAPLGSTRLPVDVVVGDIDHAVAVEVKTSRGSALWIRAPLRTTGTSSRR